MDSKNELAGLDATAQASLVARGEVTPRELVDAAIERLERHNPKLEAVIHPMLERARERADSPDLPDGPFRGVPFLMKDIGGDEAGEPYHAGMNFLKEAGYRAPCNSHFTEMVERAGLISLGRTATPELAILPTGETRAYGNPRNPWNLDHSPGGSSSGTAAAIAAGIVPMAHGSDGGGSIRIPASSCGVVGLKPTRGRCSFSPGAGERWSGLSCEFALTRSIRDTATLLDCLSGPAAGDPYTAPLPERSFAELAAEAPSRLRIGFMRATPRDIEIHPECVAAVDKTAKHLEELGHDVEETHPKALEEPDMVAHYVNIVAGNVAQSLVSFGAKVGREVSAKDVEPLTWTLAERGRSMSAQEFLAAIEYIHGFGRRLANWWDEGFDLLLTPSAAQPPPRIGTLVSTEEAPLAAYFLAAPYGVFTLPHNLSGQPGISVPLHVTAEGLPVGSQLVGRMGSEGLLLKTARQLEEAAPWADVRPPLFG